MSDSQESEAEGGSPGIDMPLRSGATTTEPRIHMESSRSAEPAEKRVTSGRSGFEAPSCGGGKMEGFLTMAARVGPVLFHLDVLEVMKPAGLVTLEQIDFGLRLIKWKTPEYYLGIYIT